MPKLILNFIQSYKPKKSVPKSNPNSINKNKISNQENNNNNSSTTSNPYPSLNFIINEDILSFNSNDNYVPNNPELEILPPFLINEEKDFSLDTIRQFSNENLTEEEDSFSDQLYMIKEKFG